MPPPLKRRAMLAPATTSAEPGRGMRPFPELDLRAQQQRCGCDPPDDDVGRLVAPPLRQVDQHHQFLRQKRLPIGTDRYLRLALHDGGLLPVDAALHLGVGRFADDHDVVIGAGLHQGFAQSLGEHQGSGKDEHDHGHPRCSQEQW